MGILDTRYSKTAANADLNNFLDKTKPFWILLDVVDAIKLRFTANVQYQNLDGDLAEFTIADDTGKPVLFNDADAAIKWVNTAFTDLIMELRVIVNGLPRTVSKVPTDAAAEAKRLLDYWTKQLTTIEKPLAKLAQIKLDQEQLGWNAPTANIGLRTQYKETLLKIQIVTGWKNMYATLKAGAQEIVNA